MANHVKVAINNYDFAHIGYQMKPSVPGSYSIVQDKNILLVDAQGPFDEAMIQQYHQDIAHYTKKMSSAPWASLITFKGKGVFTPDAEENLIATTHFRMENGMVAIAAVINNTTNGDILQMQLQRIYQSCRIKFHFFSDTRNAKIWLEGFIN